MDTIENTFNNTTIQPQLHTRPTMKPSSYYYLLCSAVSTVPSLFRPLLLFFFWYIPISLQREAENRLA